MRQPEVNPDLVGRLDPAVEILEEEHQPARGQRPAEQREQQVEGFLRAHGRERLLGSIDDPDVARLQLRADAGFLGPLQQAVVQLAAALHFAVEHAVVDRLAVHRQGVALLGVQRPRQAVLLGQRGQVLVARPLHDLADLAVHLGLRRLDRRPQLHHVRMAARRACRPSAPAGSEAAPVPSSAAG